MKKGYVEIIGSVGIGLGIAMAVIIPAGGIGAIRGGLLSALRWAQVAGFVMGGIGIAFAGLRLLGADRGLLFWRPGKTDLELQGEILSEERRREAEYKKSVDGKGSRRKVSAIWAAVGVILAYPLVEIVIMLVL